MSKPIGVAVRDEGLVVVCENGSVWRQASNVLGWLELRPIPGSPRHVAIDPKGAAEWNRTYTRELYLGEDAGTTANG
jgi:hypothetical protein